MSLQYISDNSGHTTAVIIPIDEWNEIRNKYPGIETIEGDLPQWQKDLIDSRLEKIKKDPSSLRPVDELFEELDNDD
jgi:hypothetical protein